MQILDDVLNEVGNCKLCRMQGYHSHLDYLPFLDAVIDLNRHINYMVVEGTIHSFLCAARLSHWVTEDYESVREVTHCVLCNKSMGDRMVDIDISIKRFELHMFDSHHDLIFVYVMNGKSIMLNDRIGAMSHAAKWGLSKLHNVVQDVLLNKIDRVIKGKYIAISVEYSLDLNGIT